MKQPTNYDKLPTIPVSGDSSLCHCGWPTMASVVRGCIPEGKRAVVVAECYPGVDLDEVRSGLDELADIAICAENALKSPEELAALLAPFLGDDPVFGKMVDPDLAAMGKMFDTAKTAQLRREIADARGHV